MSGPGRRFDPAELLGGPGSEPTSAELADALAAARALEAHASGDRVRPTAGFEDRVMAAIATEPAPRFMVGAAFAGRDGRGGRGGRVAATLATIRDAWAIAASGGRPLAVRAQALGFVMFVAVAAGSLTGVAAVGVGSFLAAPPSPPQTLPGPTVDPSPVGPSPSPRPSPSPNPSDGPSPTADDGGSPSPSSSPVPTETTSPSPTQRSTETPRATGTPDATNTPEPGETLKPGETVKPTESPDPSGTPDASDDHGGGSPGPG